jgi:hypothetical protein
MLFVNNCLLLNLTLILLTTAIVVPPNNDSKWQIGFNSAFKGLIPSSALLMYAYTTAALMWVEAHQACTECVKSPAMLVRRLGYPNCENYYSLARVVGIQFICKYVFTPP